MPIKCTTALERVANTQANALCREVIRASRDTDEQLRLSLTKCYANRFPHTANMTTITTQWPVGQFLTTLTHEVDDKQLGDLASLGLRFLGQRVTAVDKILGAFETGADGKSKRKPNWKRNEVEYSDELRDALTKAFGTLEFPDSSTEVPHVLSDILVDMTKYEGGAAKEPAYAAEKRAVKEYLAANGGLLKDGSKRTLESFSSNRKIDPPTSVDWEADTEFLVRVKAYLKSLNEQE